MEAGVAVSFGSGGLRQSRSVEEWARSESRAGSQTTRQSRATSAGARGNSRGFGIGLQRGLYPLSGLLFLPAHAAGELGYSFESARAPATAAGAVRRTDGHSTRKQPGEA